MYAYTSGTFGNRDKQFSRIYALSEGMSPTAIKERRKMFYCLRSFAGDATPRTQQEKGDKKTRNSPSYQQKKKSK